MVTERLICEEKAETIPRHITEEGIIDELTNLIFAGTDTTGNTLTYLFWELSHHPEWQQKLREELSLALKDYDNDFPYDAVSDLPILEAVVQETLRFRPASPSGLERLAPEGGCVIDGIVVPAHVSASPCPSSIGSRAASF
jgi:cytochrome P450